MKATRILVIDDEVQIRRLLRIGLEAQGFQIFEAETGAAGIQSATQVRPELVILDLGLPDMGGIDVLKNIRGWSQVPVIILSVQEGESDKIEALDAGADDYITKPFGMGELMARIRVALRAPASSEAKSIYRSGRLEVDLAAHVVKISDLEIKLTHTEFDLLALLIRHAGKVLTHKQILREIWGPNQENETHYLRVYMGSLRKKIEADSSDPQLIVTEPGVGYRLKS